MNNNKVIVINFFIYIDLWLTDYNIQISLIQYFYNESYDFFLFQLKVTFTYIYNMMSKRREFIQSFSAPLKSQFLISSSELINTQKVLKLNLINLLL